MLFALLFIYNQVCGYLRNEDVSVISYRKYSNTDEDKYPTFTICWSPRYYDLLFREERIKKTMAMTGAAYYRMLNGAKVKGNRITNFSSLEFDDAKWDLLYYILTYYGAYNRKKDPIKYWDTEISEIESWARVI